MSRIVKEADWTRPIFIKVRRIKMNKKVSCMSYDVQTIKGLNSAQCRNAEISDRANLISDSSESCGNMF